MHSQRLSTLNNKPFTRGKLYLDATKCRASLAQSQTLRDSFKASKIDPVMPKEGSIDPRVVELANNPSKVTTESIRNQIRVIETISSENAASLHALPYIEHEIGEDGKRRPAHTQGVDVNSSSYAYQKKMNKGWKCVQPRLNPDANQPKRAPVLMGGRFETCTRFAAYYTKKVRLEAIKSAGFDDFIASCPQGQVVLVCCVSAAVPLASSKALALLEDVNGLVWEQHGGMDTVTRKCSRKAEELPYRIVQFDIAESRILAKRYNVKAVPMYLIYYNNRLVFLLETKICFYLQRRCAPCPASCTLLNQDGVALNSDSFSHPIQSSIRIRSSIRIDVAAYNAYAAIV